MLAIQISKRRDGGSVLRCTRADGSVTWQKQEGPDAAFFPVHDLTHFAVETTLRYRRGFFGLIAEGWDIDDTTGKGRRGRLPEEAIEVERIVGLLDRERSSESVMSAEEFSGFAGRRMTEGELGAVRSRSAELLWRWRALTAGSALELRWEA
jgi:hypothetical protein